MPATLPDVALEIADGDEIGTTQLARERGLAVTSVFRWIIRGLPGANGSRVRLEAIKRGKTWLTSRAAVRRFFQALPGNPPTSPSRRSTSRPTDRSSEAREADRQRAAHDLKTRHGI